MAEYLVVNRATGESQRVEAESAQEACEACGWMIGQCYVRRLKSEPETEPVQEGQRS